MGSLYFEKIKYGYRLLFFHLSPLTTIYTLCLFLKIFRIWGCYDTFERIELHAITTDVVQIWYLRDKVYIKAKT